MTCVITSSTTSLIAARLVTFNALATPRRTLFTLLQMMMPTIARFTCLNTASAVLGSESKRLMSAVRRPGYTRDGASGAGGFVAGNSMFSIDYKGLKLVSLLVIHKCARIRTVSPRKIQ